MGKPPRAKHASNFQHASIKIRHEFQMRLHQSSWTKPSMNQPAKSPLVVCFVLALSIDAGDFNTELGLKKYSNKFKWIPD